MPFSFLNIKGYIGNGAFWITHNGSGFLVKDTSVNKLTIQEMGGGGKFLGSFFFRTINNEKDFF